MSLLTAHTSIFGAIQGALGDLCPLTPLGNRPEDVKAWENTHGKQEYKPRLSRKERYRELNIERQQKKKNIYNGVFYQLKAYYKGDNPVKSINDSIDFALKRMGISYGRTSKAKLRSDMRKRLDEAGIDYMGKSVSKNLFRAFCHINNKAIKYFRLGGKKNIDWIINQAIKQEGYLVKKDQKSALKKLIIHNLGKLGIDWKPASVKDAKKFLKRPQRSIRVKNKYLSYNTENRDNRIKSGKILRALAFAILKGRKKRFGFGMYWCRNDEDWVTLRSLHYDNCKVVFNERILFWPVYELLRLGAKVKDIVTEYGILLRKHHAMAVDSETSVWQATGLAKELKTNVCRKYLGL